MPSSKLWLLAAASVLLWPLILISSPLLVLVATLLALRNIGRATGWHGTRYRKLLLLVLREVMDHVVMYVPAMLPVLWFYVTKAPVDGVRCHIPYESYYQSWLRRIRRRARGASATPPPEEGCAGVHHINLFDTPRKCPPSPSVRSPFLSANNSFEASSGSSTPSVEPAPEAPESAVASAQKVPCFPGRGANAALCTLDVYGSAQATLQQVVIFVYGGAWGSGSKWYYATLAANLRDAAKCCVVVPDYPTYPNGTMTDMIESLHTVLQWTHDHISLHGGDPRRIVLVGHSAGAHLCALWAVRRAMALTVASSADGGDAARPLRDALSCQPCCTPALADFMALRGDFAPPIRLLGLSVPRVTSPRTADPADPSLPLPLRIPSALAVDLCRGPTVRAMLLFAAPFDLVEHFKWETQRCVENISTMRGATDGFWNAASPTLLLEQCAAVRCPLKREAFPALVRLYHDPNDRTVSMEQSVDFQHALNSAVGGADDVWCPPVVTFPHGHGAMVLDATRRKSSSSQKPPQVHAPFVQEIASFLASDDNHLKAF